MQPTMQPWLADIYQTHRRGLFALALSVLRRPELAEDAVHDAFAKVARLKAMPTGQAVSYVFAAVRNAAFDLRVKQAQIGASGRGTAEDECTPLDFAQAQTSCTPDVLAQLAEDKARVQTALGRLTHEDREVILMRLWSNLSFQEIGDVCKEPLGTVASRYYRALAQLKVHLTDHSSSSGPEARHAS